MAGMTITAGVVMSVWPLVWNPASQRPRAVAEDSLLVRQVAELQHSLREAVPPWTFRPFRTWRLGSCCFSG